MFMTPCDGLNVAAVMILILLMRMLRLKEVK